MRRRVLSVLAGLLLGAGAVAVAATPAQAAYSNCSNQYVCAFYGYSGGLPVLFTVYRSPGTCYNLDPADNDQASSIANHLANHHAIQVYRDGGCTGGHLAVACCGSQPIPAGTNTSFLPGYAAEMSSVFFNTGCIPSPCPSIVGPQLK